MGASLSGFQVLLLAAGRGRRAGGPKAWREIGGRPGLERHLEFLSGLLPLRRVAASIQSEWLERCRALAPEVRWVPADPDRPALASLQALLAEAEPAPSWVYHVDMPIFERGVFEALARATAANGADAWVPAYEGRKGHPVLLSPLMRAPLLALDPESGRLDRFLSERHVESVDVPWACVLENRN